MINNAICVTKADRIIATVAVRLQSKNKEDCADGAVFTPCIEVLTEVLFVIFFFFFERK
jgi:hypothetical protein